MGRPGAQLCTHRSPQLGGDVTVLVFACLYLGNARPQGGALCLEKENT